MIAQDIIGVDIAKGWIDAFCPSTTRHERIVTTKQALAKFAKAAKGSLVVLEASGGYERPVTGALTKAGTDYARVNPRHARAFAQALGKMAKTDRAEKNRTGTTRDPWLSKEIAVLIKALEVHLAAGEEAIANLIATSAQLSSEARRLRTVSGIGPALVAVILARLPELGHLDAKRIAALAGLAPQACDSGVHRGNRRVRGGRADVRRALYLAGFIASRFDPAIRTFRKRLEAAGKTPKLAITACARKLLTILNAMLRDGHDYAKQAA